MLIDTDIQFNYSLKKRVHILLLFDANSKGESNRIIFQS